MNIEMTVKLQAALVERLKTALANTASENLLLSIVAEGYLAELNHIKEERDNLAKRNRTLMDDVATLRAALHDLDRKNPETQE